MCDHDRCAVSDLIDKFYREQVNQKLNAEIDRNQQRDLRQWDLIRPFKCQKKKRHEIIDDRLYDVTDETGGDRLVVLVIQVEKPSSLYFFTLFPA